MLPGAPVTGLAAANTTSALHTSWRHAQIWEHIYGTTHIFGYGASCGKYDLRTPHLVAACQDLRAQIWDDTFIGAHIWDDTYMGAHICDDTYVGGLIYTYIHIYRHIYRSKHIYIYTHI